VTYDAVMSACEKGTEWEAALGLLPKMLQSLLILNVVSYSTVISACEKNMYW